MLHQPILSTSIIEYNNVQKLAATDYYMHDCCGIPTGTKLHAFYFVLWQQVLQVCPGIYYNYFVLCALLSQNSKLTFMQHTQPASTVAFIAAA